MQSGLERAWAQAAPGILEARCNCPVEKKEPRKRGSKVLRGNGGVLFRGFGAPTNLTSYGTHGGHNTQLNWFVK